MNNEIEDLVKSLLSNTKDRLLSLAIGAKDAVINAVNFYIADAKDRFKDLLQHISEGGDIKFFMKMIGKEKSILKNILSSFAIIGLGIAQEMIDTIEGIVYNSLAKVLATTD